MRQSLRGAAALAAMMIAIAPAAARAQSGSTVVEVETIELDDAEIDALSDSAAAPVAADEKPAAAEALTNSRVGVSLSKIPDLSKRVRGAESTSLAGQGTETGGSLSFSTSVAAMRREQAKKKGYQSAATQLFGASRSPVDLWMSGSYAYYRTDGSATAGDTSVMQAGVDYRIDKDIATGLFISGDLLERHAASAADARGLGYLTGPYAVVRLSDNVRFETLAAFGSTYDEVVATDASSAAYETPRLQMSSRLSGDWTVDSWTLSPSSRLSFYGESLDPIEGEAAGRNAEGRGQLTFGPEIAYKIEFDDGSLKPFAGFEGAVGFGLSGEAGADALLTTGDMSANSVLGVDAKLGDTTIRASGRCSGVGAGAEGEDCAGMSGNVEIRLPFN